jgi:hypothetical protein
MTTATITDITAEIERLQAQLEQAQKRASEAGFREFQTERLLRNRINRQRVEFTVGKEKFTVMVILKDAGSWGREAEKRTRIFTSGVDLDKINEEARPHFVAYGEQSAEYKKATRVYRAEERRIIAAALDAAGVKFEKINFSQKAGCSMCACSPGWIANGVLRIDGLTIDSIFVAQVRNADGEVK